MCVVTGLLGTSSGTTAYNENIGAMQITRVGSRFVVQLGAVCMIILGLIGAPPPPLLPPAPVLSAAPAGQPGDSGRGRAGVRAAPPHSRHKHAALFLTCTSSAPPSPLALRPGKFGGLFASIPSPLISGLFMIVFGLIAAGARRAARAGPGQGPSFKLVWA